MPGNGSTPTPSAWAPSRRPRPSSSCSSTSPARPPTPPSASRRRSPAGSRPGREWPPTRRSKTLEPSPAMPERTYDVVVFGATGFTGALTAQYLARNAPPETRIALAGRNREKLQSVQRDLGRELPLLSADIGDAGSMREMAESAKVVITTVGPYINYGEPVVAACAAAGTDYVDLTGEPEFVDRMWLKYHSVAAETGARLVHSCGFDSIPYDLGVQFTVQQLPEGVPISIDGFMRVNASISGGTYQ